MPTSPLNSPLTFRVIGFEGTGVTSLENIQVEIKELHDGVRIDFQSVGVPGVGKRLFQAKLFHPSQIFHENGRVVVVSDADLAESLLNQVVGAWVNGSDLEGSQREIGSNGDIGCAVYYKRDLLSYL